MEINKNNQLELFETMLSSDIFPSKLGADKEILEVINDTFNINMLPYYTMDMGRGLKEFNHKIYKNVDSSIRDDFWDFIFNNITYISGDIDLTNTNINNLGKIRKIYGDCIINKNTKSVDLYRVNSLIIKNSNVENISVTSIADDLIITNCKKIDYFGVRNPDTECEIYGNVMVNNSKINELAFTTVRKNVHITNSNINELGSSAIYSEIRGNLYQRNSIIYNDIATIDGRIVEK